MKQKRITPIPVLLIIIVLFVGYNLINGATTRANETIEDSIYASLGKTVLEPGARGVFKIEDVSPNYTKTVWYVDLYPDYKGTAETVGASLFSKSRLNRIFSNSEIDSILFCYCYQFESGGQDKVMMVSVSREQYQKIKNLSNYDTKDFYKYVTITDADKRDFPDLQRYIKK